MYAPLTMHANIDTKTQICKDTTNRNCKVVIFNYVLLTLIPC